MRRPMPLHRRLWWAMQTPVTLPLWLFLSIMALGTFYWAEWLWR